MKSQFLILKENPPTETTGATLVRLADEFATFADAVAAIKNDSDLTSGLAVFHIVRERFMNIAAKVETRPRVTLSGDMRATRVETKPRAPRKPTVKGPGAAKKSSKS